MGITYRVVKTAALPPTHAYSFAYNHAGLIYLSGGGSPPDELIISLAYNARLQTRACPGWVHIHSLDQRSARTDYPVLE